MGGKTKKKKGGRAKGKSGGSKGFSKGMGMGGMGGVFDFCDMNGML